MAAELRIGEIFNRYYSELCQKSKLPDSGESALADWNLSTRIEIVLIKAYLSYLCYCFYSPWQNLWVAGSSCRGSPQRDGQQLRQTLQSLSRRAKRTGVYRWNSDDVKKKKKERKILSWYFVWAVPSVELWWANAASWKQLVRCVFIHLGFSGFCFRWHPQRRNPNFLS